MKINQLLTNFFKLFSLPHITLCCDHNRLLCEPCLRRSYAGLLAAHLCPKSLQMGEFNYTPKLIKTQLK